MIRGRVRDNHRADQHASSNTASSVVCNIIAATVITTLRGSAVMADKLLSYCYVSKIQSQ